MSDPSKRTELYPFTGTEDGGHGGPNLDDFSNDPEDFVQSARVLHIMANYLERKSEAIEFRLQGQIESALRLEAECDRIYQTLPHCCRW
jgi:hypothetical protein